MYTIYTKNGCGYCKKAKDFLKNRGKKYTEIEVTEKNKEKIYEKIDSLTGKYRYFPIIFNGKNFIGGYAELDSEDGSIEIPDGNTSKTTKFRGNAAYNLKVMKYLARKYNNHCVIIPDTRLKKSIVQSEVSLRWNQKRENEVDGYISVPKGFWKALDKCKGSRRFVIFPFGFTCANGEGHANYLVYDVKTKHLERFEPYGHNPDKCIDAPGLDDAIKELLQTKWEIKRYYKPLDYMPKLGLQTLQKREGEEKSNDPVGFCSVWAAWYADLRLANPDMSRKEVIDKATKDLKNRPETFTEFVRNYSTNFR